MRRKFAVGVIAIAATFFGAGVAAAGDGNRPPDRAFNDSQPTETFSFNSRNDCVNARSREDRASSSCTWTRSGDGNNEWSFEVNRNRIQR